MKKREVDKRKFYKIFLISLTFIILGSIFVLSTTSITNNAITTTGNISYSQNLNKIFVFEGDSLTDYVNHATSTWALNLTHNYPFFADGQFFNVAHTGERITNMTTEYPTEVSIHKQTKLNDDAYLFIWAGTNDLTQNEGLPAGDANVVYANLKSYWATAKADGFKIVAFTILPRGGTGSSFEGNRTILNNLILNNSSVYDYLIRPELLFQNYSDTNNFEDTVHLTQQASNSLADYIGHNLFSNTYNSLNYKNGNVGIGTSSSDSLLTIAKSATALNVSGMLYVNSTNVGIGTSHPGGTPGGSLHVSGSWGDLFIDGNQLSSNRDPYSGLAINSLQGSSVLYLSHTATGGNIQFFTSSQPGGALNKSMVINENGYIGMGTSTPSQKLEVVGNVNISTGGNLTLGGLMQLTRNSGAMPVCNTATNSSIGSNLSGMYYCNSTQSWTMIVAG